ncbi:1f326624-f78a-486e-886a-5f9cddbfc54b [Sclerotinia trifoliorum]|uniref:1f326624-f78a-486e-886a-5f9cddbfc54b n=1 Tax=Sclerotinia trifoliorum TaxID=28548 RepID=A0A8H2VW93_9HELO|nr:1f326624-f78a-486e-886a-5f9cddbfc54b [Sclerotinia trifoliorum]
MSTMDLRSDISKVHDEPPSKKQKFTEIKEDDFENKLTVPIALELGEESRDLELKLLQKCLASSKCDIAQPAKCQCKCCLYTQYGHVVFVPHDGHQDGDKKCAKCTNVEKTVRGQYAVEISDHLPLSPEVRHDLACHFRVFREILSKMFSAEIQDLRKKMAKVKVDSIHTLQEEMLRLQVEVKMSKAQLDELEVELKRTFETVSMAGVEVSGAENDSLSTCGENMPTLLHLRKTDGSRAEPLKEEIKRLESENVKLGEKVQQLEEESVDFKTYGFQSVPIKLFTPDRKLDSK